MFDGKDIAMLILLGSSIALFAFVAGYSTASQSLEQDAIKAGVGEYYIVDPTSRKSEFRYKVKTDVEH